MRSKKNIILHRLLKEEREEMEEDKEEEEAEREVISISQGVSARV